MLHDDTPLDSGALALQRIRHLKSLPAYAQYLLDNHLQAFAVALIRISRELNVPLLRRFDGWPEEQLVALGVEGSRKLLSSLAQNDATSYLEESLSVWKANQLPQIQSGDILIEDISKVTFARRKGFRDFLTMYTRDVDTFSGVMEEVDLYTHTQEELSFKTLLEIEQHDKMRQVAEHSDVSRQLIHNAPGAIVVIDFESHVLLWNPKAEETFGWTADEIIGKSLNETIIPPEYRQQHNAGMKRLEETGVARVLNKTIEITALNHKGDEFPISLTISRSMYSGQPVFISFIRDISREKAAERKLVEQRNQLAQKARELEGSNQELMAFNYIASHDLQEPVRKIKVFSKLISVQDGEQLPERISDSAQRIHTAASHMQRLIDALIAYSRTTTGDQTTELTNLNEIVEEVKNLLRDKIEEHSAVINSGHLPTLNVIPFQIHQLLENIISNALKYSKPNVSPVITITSRDIDGTDIKDIGAVAEIKYFKISVGDNGIGFEQEYADKIFELFQRLHNKSEYSGTGIGLAICKKIVQNHHGFITASSLPGDGSTFNIYLPIQAAS